MATLAFYEYQVLQKIWLPWQHSRDFAQSVCTFKG